jgi:predicted N-acetyltransferase YhbS
MLVIAPEGPLDGPPIEILLDLTFGLGRHRKTSYRYRTGVAPVQPLCLVAREGERRLVGAIRYWPVRLEQRPALLLGPLAIDPERQGQGIGRALTTASLERAAALGWRLVFLVGDPAYYARHGFAVAPSTIVMPGEDPARLQYRTLAGAALPPAGGLLLRERGSTPGLLGPPVEVGKDGIAHQGDALVGRHAGLHLADSLGHGAGDGGVADGLGQGLDQGADGEHHRPGLGQAPQGLALDAQP